MSWDALPLEISVNILKIRNNIRFVASKKIQIAWKKYLLPEDIALDFALDIEIDNYDKIIFNNINLSKLKYSLSMCNGKHNLSFWKLFSNLLNDSLNLHQHALYKSSTPEGINYRKINILYKKLLIKFNFCK